MSRPRILFAPETMDLAETTRALAVATALGDRAEVLFVGYGGPFEHLVIEAGHAYRRLNPVYTEADMQRAWRADRMETLASPFTTPQLRERVASERAILREWQPDLVFMGFTLTFFISARAERVPLVQLVPFAFTPPFFAAGLGTWPEQFDFPGRKLLPQRWLTGLIGAWAMHTRMWMRGFRVIARENGVAISPRLLDFWTADVNLVAEVPEVTGVPELPATWEYAGPTFAKLPGEIPAEVTELPPNEPWIYCAMGSSGERRVVEAALNALGELPYRVIAPVRSLVGEDYRPPATVQLVDWLPAQLVNPLATIAVIHGGQGTVQTAVASGTPFVGIGMQPEQEWNIDFLLRAGTARKVSRRLDPARLRAAVEELIADADAFATARRLSEVYAHHDGAQITAGRLLELAAQRGGSGGDVG